MGHKEKVKTDLAIILVRARKPSTHIHLAKPVRAGGGGVTEDIQR